MTTAEFWNVWRLPCISCSARTSWSSFDYWDVVPIGIAATAAHALLVLGSALAQSVG